MSVHFVEKAKLSDQIENFVKQGYKVFNVLDNINPVFYRLWMAEESRIIAKGGRSSFKSSVISLKLVHDFIQNPEGNVVVLRKVAKYLRTSVYEQIQWAIYAMGLQDQFIFRESPMKIIHKATKTAFYFFGVDDPMKLKGAKIAVGYVTDLWFEELAEFSGVEDIDVVEDSFIRQDLGEGKSVKVYMSYNPPRNPFNWVNEYAASKEADEDTLVHSSSYQDDLLGFLSGQMLKKIEQYRIDDPEYWAWMYMGKVTGYGDLIYNPSHLQPADRIPTDDKLMLVFIASDAGHMKSATTHLALGWTRKGNVYLLDTYYYSPADLEIKKAPSEMSSDYKIFIDKVRAEWKVPIKKFTIDSAEGALRNQIYKDYRIRLSPVAKKDKLTMIDYVTTLLAEKRFYYIDRESNKVFVNEHQMYRMDPKTIAAGKTPKPIEVDDHTVDAFQYFVIDNLKLLKLAS